MACVVMSGVPGWSGAGFAQEGVPSGPVVGVGDVQLVFEDFGLQLQPVGDGVFVGPEPLFGAYLVQVRSSTATPIASASASMNGCRNGPVRVIDPGCVGADPADDLDEVNRPWSGSRS